MLIAPPIIFPNDIGGLAFPATHIVERMIAARKTFRERRLAAFVEDEQVPRATQTPAPAFL